MKKIVFLLLSVVFLSCSKDDECREVTSLEAKQTSTGMVYTIQIDNGETVITNKATVDFYKHSAAPECFEGYK